MQDEDWISELVERLWPYMKAAAEQMAWETLPGGCIHRAGRGWRLAQAGVMEDRAARVAGSRRQRASMPRRRAQLRVHVAPPGDTHVFVPSLPASLGSPGLLPLVTTPAAATSACFCVHQTSWSRASPAGSTTSTSSGWGGGGVGGGSGAGRPVPAQAGDAAAHFTALLGPPHIITVVNPSPLRAMHAGSLCWVTRSQT